ncbi:hypothetical protein [Euzebya tangerina]|uniref:hypothetical protein n=1 Tax=Euzebya tangerina TaxID=591198 RepID=UPI000E31940B|nr:hypothetical protein [Euzebya tangerina]
MPTPPDPTTAIAADSARVALQRLADASRGSMEPAEAYQLLGAVHAGMASLDAVLRAVAHWHDEEAPYAHTRGSQATGHADASAAATHLRDAAALISQAGAIVDAAWARNGRISWPPPTRQTATPVRPPQPQSPTRRGGRDDGLHR